MQTTRKQPLHKNFDQHRISTTPRCSLKSYDSHGIGSTRVVKNELVDDKQKCMLKRILNTISTPNQELMILIQMIEQKQAVVTSYQFMTVACYKSPQLLQAITNLHPRA